MAYFHITSGKRDGWRIKVKAGDLQTACDARIVYHGERITFWQQSLEKAESTLRAEGITLRHFEVTGGERTEAQLDPGLAKRVGECQNKVANHKDEIRHFQAYKAFLALSVEETMELTVDDVLYFNLKNADVESE